MHDANLISPLVPQEVDLRNFPYMPLDVVRLRDSDMSVITSAEAFRAAVMLWCASWHQQPAASLPDDDRLLARFAGFGRDMSGWAEVRTEALHGFVRCSDGRLYHPVIAEKANETWEKSVNIETVTEGVVSRQKRWRERTREISAMLRARGVTPPAGASLKALERMLKDASVDGGDADVDGSVDVAVDASVDGGDADVDGSVDVAVDASVDGGDADVDGAETSTETSREMPFNITEHNNIRQDGSAVPRPEASPEIEVGQPEREKPTKPPKASKRGSRIDLAWTPDAADRDFAVSVGIPERDIDRHGAEFRDYWAGVSGAKGLKLDWPATWRNRCRQIAEHKGYRPPAGAPTVCGAAPALPSGWPSGLPDPERLFAIWIAGRWSQTAWGFPPGDPSCRIPPNIVSEWQKRQQEAA